MSFFAEYCDFGNKKRIIVKMIVEITTNSLKKHLF